MIQSSREHCEYGNDGSRCHAVAAVQIVFYLSPLLIAAVTLFLAWWRFKIFRIREPAVTIDIQVTSRRSSPSYNALNAVAILTNTSRVVVEITRVEWTVSVLSPYTDEEVERKIDEYAPRTEVDYWPIEFPWNVNYRLMQRNPSISLEPGASNTVSMSLAIPNWIEAVDVLMELDNPPESEGRPLHWVARRSHDMNQEA